MKLKLSLSAALMAGVISASATTENAAAPAAPAAVIAPVAATNSTADDMKALFGDPVIVKAKGFEIKRSELDQVLSGAKANAAAQGQQLPPSFDIEVLDQLITIQLLLQKATAADRAAGQAEADDQYAKLLKRFGSEQAFERQLKAVGMTVADLRGKALQESVAKTALKTELNVKPTDEEAKAYYAKHAADFEQPELAHVRHLLLLTVDPASRAALATNTIAAKRQQIDDLRKRVVAGEDFATLAKQYSEDPGSKENGGELPEFPHGQMMPEFESAAFALSSNQVSEVVTTAYGFHVIKLIDKTAAKKYAYDDTIPQLNDTVASVCKKSVEVEKIKVLAPDYIKKLRADASVELLDPALKAQSEKQEALQALQQEAAPVAPTAPENSK
jgi:parvulin-like peptidyl-prolyl isomerase